MIEFKKVVKRFGDVKAIDDVSAAIDEGHVFGLIGTNGAGKSTLMRLASGVLRADRGSVVVDGEEIYDNPAGKANIFYISDDQYFFRNGTPMDMLRLYRTYYPGFDSAKWQELMGKFGLDQGRKVNTFSKGMKKQLSILCGISANTKYLFCDEPNSGLDPKTSILIDELLYDITHEYNITTIINTHDMNSVLGIGENIVFINKGHRGWVGDKQRIFKTSNEALNDFVFATRLFQEVKDYIVTHGQDAPPE